MLLIYHKMNIENKNNDFKNILQGLKLKSIHFA